MIQIDFLGGAVLKPMFGIGNGKKMQSVNWT